MCSRGRVVVAFRASCLTRIFSEGKWFSEEEKNSALDRDSTLNHNEKVNFPFSLSVLSFFLFSGLIFPTPGVAAPQSMIPSSNGESVRIRVRLTEGVPTVSVSGIDLKAHSSQGASQTLATGQWEFQCQNHRIRAVQRGKSASAFDFFSPVSITTPAGFLHWKGLPFREELRIFSRGSLCEVLNVLDLEKYLDGLVNSEFSSHWNEEAIQAQIVAARSYAYHQLQGSKKHHYDVDSTVRDQVYRGSIREDSRSSRLVAKTRGLVLMIQGRKSIQPLKAFYHSTCGGKTELPERVWGVRFPGFRQPVMCSFCAQSPAIRWELELPTSEIQERFRQRAVSQSGAVKIKKGPKNWKDWVLRGDLTEVRVEEPVAGSLEHERVSQLLTQWSLGGQEVQLLVSGARFRDWMGSSRFRSAAFEVSRPRSGGQKSWYFRGRGYGHGVGMCQYGTKVMGEKGFRMANILKYYYPDAILRKLW